MEPTRERFDRNVKAKATIGDPFTMEDVARSLDVSPGELHSAWLLPFISSGTIRKVGTQPSRIKSNRSRHVTLWQGTYYLDLEAEERLQLANELIQEYEAEFGVITQEEMDACLIAG